MIQNPVYIKNDFSLYLGNCIEVLNQLAEESVDMIFADPPYYLSDGTITCQNGRIVSVYKDDWDMLSGFDNKAEFHRLWIKACRRVLKPTGTIWVSGTYHSIYQCGYELQRQGFKILNDICWFKPNAAPNLSRRCFTASHETLIWAIKDSCHKQVFNYEIMKNGEWTKDKLKIPNKQMRSVWSIAAPSFKEKGIGKHPTQKPVSLLDRIVLASTNEGDLILDPFNGSGTTGVVAYVSKRKYIGIDISSEYIQLTVSRLEKLLK